jgi:7-cyano-7-deazaguanine synthase
MKDTILSLSGGLDSSSLLFEYKDRIKLCVSFKYPSNHNAMELKAARRVAKKAGIPHKIIDVTKVFKNFKSALLSGADAVPNAEYSAETIAQLVVPFRNGIFLSILAGLAESTDCEYIALANHSGDHAVYSDCRPEFTDAMNSAITAGTSNNVKFFSPYVNISKAEIAARGMKAGLNPDWTYSCYKGGAKPCNQCPTCVERNDAIIKALNSLKD